MRKSGVIFGVAGAAAVLTCGLLLLGALPRPVDITVGEPDTQPAATTASIADDPQASALFDGLTTESVTQLSVQTEQASYAFHRFSATRVSVNGQKADSEVFSVLVDNILTMPVVSISPFTPTTAATLTLILSAEGVHYTVLFYRDEDPENPYICIIAQAPDDTRYRKTDSWQLGTLLLTCEGTRIQDAQGAETPFE